MNGNGCISQLKTEVLSLTKRRHRRSKKALSMFAKEIGAENVPKEFKILPRTITMFIKSNEGKEFCKFLQDSQRLLDFLNSPDESDSTGHDVLDITGKETAVDNPVETQNKIRRQNNWLHKAWGLYDLSRVKFLEALKRDFNQFVLKPYYSSTQRATDDALNYLIKDFIIYKINRLKTYLDSINVDTSAIKDPFETDNPQEVIENILKTYRNIFYNEDGSLKLTSQQLKAYQNPDTRIKNSDKDIAQAYADYLVIDPFHLDSFIKTNVKTIEIKNSVGTLTSANNKYGMKLGKGRQISSWQNEDSLYVISQHVDDTVQIEISSWPKYRKIPLE